MASFYWYERRRAWVLEAVDPRSGKRRKWYLGPDKAAAEAEQHRILYGLLKSQSDRRPGRITLAALAEGWLEWNRTNAAPATVRFRRSYLRWLVDGAVAFRPAAELSPDEVECVKAARARQNSPRSVNHFVRTVKSLYRWGLRQRLLAANPLEHVQGVPNAPRRQRNLTGAQTESILRALDASAPLGDFARILLATGLRAGELAGLPWEAYDASEGTLTITRHKTATRANAGPRLLPVAQAARQVIEAQPHCGPAIFSNARGQPLTSNAFYQRLRQLQAARDKDGSVSHPELEGFGFHRLRHTFASRLAAQQVHPFVARELLGHSSTVMTLYYTEIEMGRLREAVEKAGQV